MVKKDLQFVEYKGKVERQLVICNTTIVTLIQNKNL